MNPALFSSAKEDWETPREFFERLDGEFHFDLDVCAFPHNAKCLAYFTKEDDGLARDWGKHTCWMPSTLPGAGPRSSASCRHAPIRHGGTTR